jgi:hypothetical protein
MIALNLELHETASWVRRVVQKTSVSVCPPPGMAAVAAGPERTGPT